MPSASNHSGSSSNLSQSSDVSADDLMKNLMQMRRKQRIKLSGTNTPDSTENSFNSTPIQSSGSNNLKELSAQLKCKQNQYLLKSVPIRYRKLTVEYYYYIVSELELKQLLERFRNASDEDGLLDKKHFFSIAKNTLVRKFDSTSLPAFHRIYEAFDLDGYVLNQKQNIVAIEQ